MSAWEGCCSVNHLPTMFRLVAVALIVLAGIACGADNAADDAAGRSGTHATSPVDLAPELTEISEWLNTEPLTLAGLRGNPVLLVFWRDT
jgi:hypothetical protein